MPKNFPVNVQRTKDIKQDFQNESVQHYTMYNETSLGTLSSPTLSFPVAPNVQILSLVPVPPTKRLKVATLFITANVSCTLQISIANPAYIVSGQLARFFHVGLIANDTFKWKIPFDIPEKVTFNFVTRSTITDNTFKLYTSIIGDDYTNDVSYEYDPILFTGDSIWSGYPLQSSSESAHFQLRDSFVNANTPVRLWSKSLDGWAIANFTAMMKAGSFAITNKPVYYYDVLGMNDATAYVTSGNRAAINSQYLTMYNYIRKTIGSGVPMFLCGPTQRFDAGQSGLIALALWKKSIVDGGTLGPNTYYIDLSVGMVAGDTIDNIHPNAACHLNKIFPLLRDGTNLALNLNLQ